MRYQYTPIRMAKIQSTDSTKGWWGYGATETLIYCWGECKMVQPLSKTVWWFLTRLNLLLPYDLAITLLGVNFTQRSWKFMSTPKTCTQKLIAALFINTKAWKQLRCPSVGEWINKLVYPDNGIFIQCRKELSCQAIKRRGGILNAYCLVKEVNLKRLYTIWFQLYDILGKATLWRQQKDQWLPGVREEVRMNWWGIEDF